MVPGFPWFRVDVCGIGAAPICRYILDTKDFLELSGSCWISQCGTLSPPNYSVSASHGGETPQVSACGVFVFPAPFFAHAWARAHYRARGFAAHERRLFILDIELNNADEFACQRLTRSCVIQSCSRTACWLNRELRAAHQCKRCYARGRYCRAYCLIANRASV